MSTAIGPRIQVVLTIEQHKLLLRALAMAASRLEAQARSNPRGRKCSAHEKNAAEMRTLQFMIARCRPSVEAGDHAA